MKKILLGLVAMVLFTNLMFANNVDLLKNNALNNTEKNNFSVLNEEIGRFCFDVTLSVNVGIFEGSVSVEVCCYKKAAFSPKYGCDFAQNLRTSNGRNFTNGYININSLDEKMIDVINSKNIEEVTITKSETVEFEGKRYTVKDGKYKIERDEDGKFIKVDLIIE